MSAVQRLCAQVTAAAVGAVLARYPRHDRPKVVRSKAEKARRRAVTKKKKQKRAARAAATGAGAVANVPAAAVEPREATLPIVDGTLFSLMLTFFEVKCERSDVGCSWQEAVLAFANFGLSVAQVRHVIAQLCFERYLAPICDDDHFQVTGAHDGSGEDLSESVLSFFRFHDGRCCTVLEAAEALQQTYATHPQVKMTYPEVGLIVDQLVADGYLYSPAGDDYYFKYTL